VPHKPVKQQPALLRLHAPRVRVRRAPHTPPARTSVRTARIHPSPTLAAAGWAAGAVRLAAEATLCNASTHTVLLGAETRFNSREGARERLPARITGVPECRRHVPTRQAHSLAYLDSSNRAHTHRGVSGLLESTLQARVGVGGLQGGPPTRTRARPSLLDPCRGTGRSSPAAARASVCPHTNQ
jgi:hypothetical protein